MDMPRVDTPESREAEAAPEVETALLAQRVEKVYPNGTRALAELRLQVRQGEFVSLLGPSGCGKSTLLRMFAGLETPSAGNLAWWGSTRPPHVDARQGADGDGAAGGRSLSMVFQEATLMPWARVRGNARLPLDLRRVARASADARVDEVLRLVGLDKFARAWPRELSGGMRMRVSLARALVTDPGLLLLDEPFGALDEFTRHRLDSEVRRLWGLRDMTVVFVTHSISEAVFLSTRVVVMAARPGRVVADVPIEGPAQRDDEWRNSPEFLRHCRDLSALLHAAADSGA